MKEVIKNLSGYSGSRLFLLRDADEFIVRKKFGKTSYNIRLKKQFIKQKIELENINTPYGNRIAET